MLTQVVIVVVVLVLLFAVYVAMRPPTFRVARTVTIEAPAEIPFGFINDFRQWSMWSPFDRLDPAMKRTFSGADSGVGAGYAWSGNSKAGVGRMSLRESKPYERVVIDLYFEKPIKANNVSEFDFTPAPEGVYVTWAVSGDNTVMGKLFSVFVSMDKMLGAQFEEGLGTLKRVSEAEARRRSANG